MYKMSHLSVAERIAALSMPEPNSGCWLWLGFLNWCGYGIMQNAGKRTSAPRVSYEHFVGPIPRGLVLDHKCRTRSCVNPWHLEPVDERTNIRRGTSFSAKNAAKTHCKRGHELSGDNLYARKDGGRQCGPCKRETVRRRRERTRAEAPKFRTEEETA